MLNDVRVESWFWPTPTTPKRRRHGYVPKWKPKYTLIDCIMIRRKDQERVIDSKVIREEAIVTKQSAVSNEMQWREQEEESAKMKVESED